MLIIDDDLDFTDLHKANLKETGKYKVYVENHGLRAFHVAEAFRADSIPSVPSMAKVKPHEQFSISFRHSLPPQPLSSKLPSFLLKCLLTLRLSTIR